MWATANLLGHDYKLGIVKGRNEASFTPSFGDPRMAYCSFHHRASKCVSGSHYESYLKRGDQSFTFSGFQRGHYANPRSEQRRMLRCL